MTDVDQDHDGIEIDDDELTALALAADPDVAVAADAPSLAELLSDPAHPPLPGWYMPSIALARLDGWRRCVAVAMVTSFVVTTAYGLCATYGHV